jgi:hypothetical protein
MYCDGCAKSEGQAVKAERENLALRAENTALKARLAEAEKALEESSVLYNAATVRKVEALMRAEAAERERDGYQLEVARVIEERAEARKDANDLERKCAELSAALLYVHPMPPNHAPRTIIPCLACAALASQPAPEPTMADLRASCALTDHKPRCYCTAQPAPEGKPTCGRERVICLCGRVLMFCACPRTHLDRLSMKPCDCQPTPEAP